MRSDKELTRVRIRLGPNAGRCGVIYDVNANREGGPVRSTYKVELDGDNAGHWWPGEALELELVGWGICTACGTHAHPDFMRSWETHPGVWGMPCPRRVGDHTWSRSP